MNNEIVNYVDARKLRGVVDSKVMNKAISETLDKGQRFFPNVKAFTAITHGLNEFFQPSPLQWQMTTDLSFACTIDEGMVVQVHSAVDPDGPDISPLFISIVAFEHKQPLTYHSLTGKELGDLHLEMGRTYKDYSYPPSVIFWSMSSWFQGAGWICDTFTFDKETNAVHFLFIEPTERKQTIEMRVDFNVMISDCDFVSKIEPEPEPEPEPVPVIEVDDGMDNIYIIEAGFDTNGRMLIESGIYRFVKEGDKVLWETIPNHLEKVKIGTTYIRLGRFMLRDKFLKRTFDLYNEYRQAGLDMNGMVRFCDSQGDPNEIFNQRYTL